MVFYCTSGVFADQTAKFILRVVSFGAGANLSESPDGLSARVGEAFFASSVFTLMEYLVRYGHLSKCCRDRCHNLEENWGERRKVRWVAFLAGAGISFLSEGLRKSLSSPEGRDFYTWPKTFIEAFPFLLATELIVYCLSAMDRVEQAAFENAASREATSTTTLSDRFSYIQSSESDVNYSQFEGSEVITID